VFVGGHTLDSRLRTSVFAGTTMGAAIPRQEVRGQQRIEVSMAAISASGGSSRRARSSSASGPRVRWDRMGRVAMLCVLVALAFLYASAGLHMLSTWRQSHRDGATVAAMQREHTLLVHQREALSAPGTLEAEARQLGMMRRGEQPYVITGLPRN
jgi:hypothetical protein